MGYVILANILKAFGYSDDAWRLAGKFALIYCGFVFTLILLGLAFAIALKPV